MSILLLTLLNLHDNLGTGVYQRRDVCGQSASVVLQFQREWPGHVFSRRVESRAVGRESRGAAAIARGPPVGLLLDPPGDHRRSAASLGDPSAAPSAARDGDGGAARGERRGMASPTAARLAAGVRVAARDERRVGRRTRLLRELRARHRSLLQQRSVRSAARLRTPSGRRRRQDASRWSTRARKGSASRGARTRALPAPEGNARQRACRATLSSESRAHVYWQSLICGSVTAEKFQCSSDSSIYKTRGHATAVSSLRTLLIFDVIILF